MIWVSGSGAGAEDEALGRQECENCRVQLDRPTTRHCANCGHTYGKPAPRRRTLRRRRMQPTLNAR